ncbi:SIMPL domain-containing protein [Candidatus Amesbacteria bacterium]|nr:SIMPL domain-containing protein [Candidatus Amesbacteria bacterium]
MKDLGKILLIFVLAYLFLRFSPAIPISSTVSQKPDLFTVDGTGKVTAVPDTAAVELGVNTTRPSVKAAQTEANNIINKITADLKKLEIPEKDIKTSHYSIYPNYDYRDDLNRVLGYQVSTGLTVTVKNLDKINAVLDTATTDGANVVGGIQFTVDDTLQKQLMQQARDLAVKEAKDQAVSLARSAGISLGRIVNIQETSPFSPRPIYMTAEKLADGRGGDTQIQPGSTDITSSVTLSYETR